MKHKLYKINPFFLTLISTYSLADSTAIDNLDWCHGEVSYLTQDFIEFNQADLSMMRPTQSTNSTPSHDLDDDWNKTSAKVNNYCNNLSTSLSLNPDLTSPIFIGPDTFFDGAEITYNTNNPNIAFYSNHHETYRMSHGIKFICAFCSEQTSDPIRTNKPTF